MKIRAFQQVDVFTHTAFLGNPLAVVLDGEGLSEAQMQAFARWTQLSETTFVLPPTPQGAAGGADYRVRIYTPGGELPFAGHPTLGTAHAWRQAGGLPRQPGVMVQECGVGLVRLQKLNSPSKNDTKQDRWAFAAPALQRRTLTDKELAPFLTALGLQADEVVTAQHLNNGPSFLALLVNDVDRLLSLEPDHNALKRLGLMVGVAARRHDHPANTTTPLIRRANREARAFATAQAPKLTNGATTDQKDFKDLTDPSDLEVRVFTSAVDIPEDPVTGSFNASLAQWLMAENLMPLQYIARQGTMLGRAGLVYVSQDEAGQVWVGGDVVDCIQGQVRL
jgi:PhzF family phenazine biosynthesis protein